MGGSFHIFSLINTDNFLRWYLIIEPLLQIKKIKRETWLELRMLQNIHWCQCFPHLSFQIFKRCYFFFFILQHVLLIILDLFKYDKCLRDLRCISYSCNLHSFLDDLTASDRYRSWVTGIYSKTRCLTRK